MNLLRLSLQLTLILQLRSAEVIDVRKTNLSDQRDNVLNINYSVVQFTVETGDKQSMS